MEGIPTPDVADYKRRKEIELGLNPGSVSQPQAKRAKTESRVIGEEELRRSVSLLFLLPSVTLDVKGK